MEATRESFGKQLVECAKNNKRILAINADLGKATKLSLFEDAYPDRFIEVGIAENNMIGIASGLSEHGYRVFVASFASFLTGKYDTIRCSLSYSGATNVILVGSHGGMAIGKDGVTQMGLEDISIMRSLPNMQILNPATPIETREITKYLCQAHLSSNNYLRIGRQPAKEYFHDDYIFDGKAREVRKGKSMDKVIFSTGCILEEVMKVAEELDISVWNFPVLKPIDKYPIFVEVRRLMYRNNTLNTKSVIYTVEDHSVIGGLGSAIGEVLTDLRAHPKLVKIGLQDEWPEAGIPSDLYDKYGLSAKKIKEKIIKESFLNDK